MKDRAATALIAFGGLTVVAAFAYLVFSPVAEEEAPARKGRPVPAVEIPKADGGRRVSDRGRAAKAKDPAAKRAVRRSVKMPEDWYARLPSADKALGKRIQDAQDAGDREAVFAAADAVLTSKSPEVRQAAVDALSLQEGAEAIPHLQKYLSDANEGVATAAYQAWDQAVDGIDFEITRVKTITEALSQVRDDEHLKSAVDKLGMMERPRAIRALAGLARDGDVRVKAAAKKSYEELTGDKFESWAAAELKAMAADRANAAAAAGTP